jgi:3-hydroxyacyl-CoA dehydrogenase
MQTMLTNKTNQKEPIVSNFIVRRVAVLGAGVMGAQIAAHCANAQVPVILFDLPAKEGPKNGVVQKAIGNLTKLKPAPLVAPKVAQYIQAANYEEHLHLLQQCDLVIEAIAERMDWKHDLYKKVAPHIAAHAIFATNTSGLSISTLSEGFDDDLKSRFCGVHFFNPPRYMHLCELIPLTTTRPEILDNLETFLTSTLGKGVIRAKDTPNFVANRVGVAGMLATMVEAKKYGIGFDVVDQLTGSALGRAKSATFRTADVVGLDTMHHVIATMQNNLPNDPFAAMYIPSRELEDLIAAGALGQKANAGFFKKEGKQILVYDPATKTHVASDAKADDAVLKILKNKNTAQRLEQLRNNQHPHAQFLWAIFRDSFHYIALHLDDIAHSARDIDFSLRWGFGWKEGPFETWQAAGWKQVAQWVKADIDSGQALCAAPLPQWVFEGPVADRGGVYSPDGAYSPMHNAFVSRQNLPVYQRQIFRAPVQGETTVTASNGGTTVKETDAVRMWTAPGHDDVLVLSLKTKMHTISTEVLVAVHEAIALAEANYKGLVFWSDGEPFSAGADLQVMMPVFMAGGGKAVEPFVEAFQRGTSAWKYAQVPTVVAIQGLALGGGCEFAMHSAARVVHVESYIGLVEVGVGLIPAGGGLKEIAINAALAAQKQGSTDVLAFLKDGFMNAATAKVGTSAHECRDLGYVKEGDPIVFNSHELLFVAISKARSLYEQGYRPPQKAQNIPVAGKSALATIKSQLVNMRDGGFISKYDYHLGCVVAEVVCGGDLDAGTLVDEEWFLRLERSHFVKLIDNPKTQERILGMLQTGKPVRN